MVAGTPTYMARIERAVGSRGRISPSLLLFFLALFFVIAANSREVGNGTVMLHALDYAAAANADPTMSHLRSMRSATSIASNGPHGSAMAITTA